MPAGFKIRVQVCYEALYIGTGVLGPQLSRLPKGISMGDRESVGCRGSSTRPIRQLRQRSTPCGILYLFPALSENICRTILTLDDNQGYTSVPYASFGSYDAFKRVQMDAGLHCSAVLHAASASGVQDPGGRSRLPAIFSRIIGCRRTLYFSLHCSAAVQWRKTL